jgi:hypothetical protein
MSCERFSKAEFLTHLILFLLSLSLFLITASIRGAPGYMDESYYAVGARSLYAGEGFWDQFIWHYLDDPAGLPNPSHTYWMPLPSILAASGMVLFAQNTYLAGALPMALISAFIPLLVYRYAGRTSLEKKYAFAAALIAMFGGYYLVYYSAIESFGLVMVAGFGYFYCLSTVCRKSPKSPLFVNAAVAGLLAGLLHLSRAEGLLWAIMIPVFYFVTFYKCRGSAGYPWKAYIAVSLTSVGTYLLVMFPWYMRNVSLWGSLTPPGSSLSLWLTNYNDLFSFPASVLTPQRWLSQGTLSIISARLSSLGNNFLTFAGVQTMIIFLPFFVVGVMKKKHQTWVINNLIGYGILLGFMSMLFPFAASRGGFLHASSAFSVFVWIMTAVGLKEVITKLPTNKNVAKHQLENLVLVMLVVITGVISLYLFSIRVVGEFDQRLAWRQPAKEFMAIDKGLSMNGVWEEDIIFINDPPSFHWVSNRPALVIPNGDEKVLLAAMNRYRGTYLVLQKNHPPGLSDLFANPELSDSFVVIEQTSEWKILETK